LIFALGKGSQLVGVTTYCTYPAETAHIEKIGDFLHPNYEKILSLKPSRIFLENWISSKTVAELKDLHLPVVETKAPRSFAEIFDVIQEVGVNINRKKEASDLIGELRREMDAIKAKGAALSFHPKVYIEIDPPTWTVGQESFLTEAINYCGGEN